MSFCYMSIFISFVFIFFLPHTHVYAAWVSIGAEGMSTPIATGIVSQVYSIENNLILEATEIRRDSFKSFKCVIDESLVLASFKQTNQEFINFLTQIIELNSISNKHELTINCFGGTVADATQSGNELMIFYPAKKVRMESESNYPVIYQKEIDKKAESGLLFIHKNHALKFVN